MTVLDRCFFADVDGTGNYVLRVSKPGFDVWTEPLRSRNIGFDSRADEIGTVVTSGLWTFGGGPIYFPTMAYEPIVLINQVDTNGSLHNLLWANWNSINAHHYYFPVIGYVTTNSLTIAQYSIPWYDTASAFGYAGTVWAYTVFGMGG